MVLHEVDIMLQLEIIGVSGHINSTPGITDSAIDVGLQRQAGTVGERARQATQRVEVVVARTVVEKIIVGGIALPGEMRLFASVMVKTKATHTALIGAPRSSAAGRVEVHRFLVAAKQ